MLRKLLLTDEKGGEFMTSVFMELDQYTDIYDQIGRLSNQSLYFVFIIQ